ncbi:MAG TPA: biopolymer transporter ExbD [Burkholderiales bacterium]|nr:biopolymer transporter ExbD [Burkholderiales bacterium]
MNFRRGESREDVELNLIPLIDVLLVILIFLMVTTTYAKYSELQINLPEAAGDAPKDKPIILNVAVDSHGRYVVNNKPVTFTDATAFGSALQQAAGGAKDPVVNISADAGATHQSVVNIMEAARLAGYSHITFTTEARPAR